MVNRKAFATCLVSKLGDRQISWSCSSTLYPPPAGCAIREVGESSTTARKGVASERAACGVQGLHQAGAPQHITALPVHAAIRPAQQYIQTYLGVLFCLR